jgi:hypothetical protein
LEKIIYFFSKVPSPPFLFKVGQNIFLARYENSAPNQDLALNLRKTLTFFPVFQVYPPDSDMEGFTDIDT